MDTVETPPSFPRPRRYPRLELRAFVEVRADGAMLQLPVRNISRGGVLVRALDEDLSRFTIGDLLTVMIVDASGDLDAAAHVAGRVVRHDADGMALSWDEDADGVGTVGAFLDRFYSKR